MHRPDEAPKDDTTATGAMPRARVAEAAFEWDPGDSRDIVRLVELLAPSGESQLVPSFWDGDTTWRIRFRATQAGSWVWRSPAAHSGPLTPSVRTGSVVVGPELGDGPPVVRGGIAVASDRRSLLGGDGRPFFWMADTAWNGPLRASAQDWQRYLAVRAEQGFTAVQIVTTQWLASPSGDALGRPAYSGSEPIHVDPIFFRRMDERVDAIARAGLVVVPVLLWAAEWAKPEENRVNPGTALGVDDAITLARYMIARWHAHSVAWILGGDGPYEGPRSERWKLIGRSLFEEDHAPVTMHPTGMQWPADSFGHESWYDFIGYQSGHRGDEASLDWLASGPPATDWRRWERPVINLEPPYEGIGDLASGKTFDARDVRRALYWSLLNVPTSGVTYGAHGIWGWDEGGAPTPAHEGFGVAPGWRAMLRAPAAEQVRHLRTIFDGIPWWHLRPDPSAIAGRSDPSVGTTPMVAVTEGPGRRVTVVYLPDGGTVVLRSEVGPERICVRYDPASGQSGRQEMMIGPVVTGDRPQVTLETPIGQDWLIVIEG